MPNIHLRKGWMLPERLATPEHIHADRRAVLKAMGLAAVGTAGLLAGAAPARAASHVQLEDTLSGLRSLDAERNQAYEVGRPLTPEKTAAQYNNFYEFSREKKVWHLSTQLTTDPWTLEVGGMVNKPRTYDVDELVRRMPLEERVYRFRCVEAWSMVVPWVGFPLKALLDEVEPQGSAKYVKMQTFMRPEEAPRQGESSWFGPSEPWPYTEGLTVAEATNEMTLLSVGIYGHVLPNQHGAPIRLVVPWKYGFKNLKSIVRIELTEERPETFWHSLVPSEYGFVSNVNPDVPHPRWSQARERDIATGDRIATHYLNGYAEQVGHLYERQA